MSLHNTSKRPRLDTASQMDLLSLPDEMLASVFKYHKFKRLQQLRKISKKIDALFDKYDIGLLDFCGVTISVNKTNLTTWGHSRFTCAGDSITIGTSFSRIVFEDPNTSFLRAPMCWERPEHLFTKYGDAQSILKQLLYFIFRKFKRIERLVIDNDVGSITEHDPTRKWNEVDGRAYRLRKGIYSEQDVDHILGKARKTRIKSLEALGAVFTFGSAIQLKQFLQYFNFKELTLNDDLLKYSLTDDIVDELSFKCLDWKQPSEITTKGLLKLCKRKVPEELSIISILPISATDIANLFKALMQENNASWKDALIKKKRIRWNFYDTDAEPLNEKDIKQIYLDLKIFKCVRIIKRPKERIEPYWQNPDPSAYYTEICLSTEDYFLYENNIYIRLHPRDLILII